jgi:biopolymer transport protein TolQ
MILDLVPTGLAVAAQMQAGQPGGPVSMDIVSLISRMSPVVIAVLILLIALSVLSWGIIFDKWRMISVAREQSRGFLGIFRKSTRFSEVQQQCQKLKSSPLVGMFIAGYSELRYQLNVSQPEVAGNYPGATVVRGKARIQNLESINRALQRAQSVEINKLERSLNFLATVAGASPFIGLFGTVVGIISAFLSIGASGSTSLATVAPGIAEALIVTAAGLFAAIPALIGYNALLNRIKTLASDMDDFSLEFISVTERSFMDPSPSGVAPTS